MNMSVEIKWVAAHKIAPCRGTEELIATELRQCGHLVVKDVVVADRVVYYKVDSNLEKKVAREVAIFIKGLMKGLQHR
jgi:hypothetical protein